MNLLPCKVANKPSMSEIFVDEDLVADTFLAPEILAQQIGNLTIGGYMRQLKLFEVYWDFIAVNLKISLCR